MKDAAGNWHISQALNVGKYDNQRIAAETIETDETEQPGFELNAFPNPYTTGFTIEFYVADETSLVRLDVVNSQGTVVKTVVDNPHAKGKWQYEVKALPDNGNEILYCRLKMNESYTVKKLLHAGP